MNSRRSVRKMRNRKNKKRLILSVSLTVVALIVLGIIFFFPLNNFLRSVTGNDTPSDKVVKSELVKKVKSKKTGDPKNDEKINRAASILGKKKMSEIISAAKSENKTANLISDSSSLSKTQ